MCFHLNHLLYSQNILGVLSSIRTADPCCYKSFPFPNHDLVSSAALSFKIKTVSPASDSLFCNISISSMFSIDGNIEMYCSASARSAFVLWKKDISRFSDPAIPPRAAILVYRQWPIGIWVAAFLKARGASYHTKWKVEHAFFFREHCKFRGWKQAVFIYCRLFIWSLARLYDNGHIEQK